MLSRTTAAAGASRSTQVAGPLGLVLPTFPQERTTPPDARELAVTSRRAEAAGAGALWACDHLFWHTPATECLSAVTAAATATERVNVGSCVLQLPLRQAAAVAKQAASIDSLSRGRLVLGVGVGSHPGEYEAARVAYADRGRRLDEGIGVLRRCWSGIQGAARYRQLPGAREIPVWAGGSSEAALRRAARLADGWIPLFMAPDEYAAALARLDKEAERAGRDPRQVCRAIVVFVAMGGATTRDKALEWMSSLYQIASGAFRRHLVSGSVRETARTLVRYFEAGAEHVAVFVTTDDPAAPFEDLAGALGELMPAAP